MKNNCGGEVMHRWESVREGDMSVFCVCMKRKEKRIEREGSDCVAGQERGREKFVIVWWGSCGSKNLILSSFNFIFLIYLIFKWAGALMWLYFSLIALGDKNRFRHSMCSQ